MYCEYYFCFPCLFIWKVSDECCMYFCMNCCMNSSTTHRIKPSISDEKQINIKNQK